MSFAQRTRRALFAGAALAGLALVASVLTGQARQATADRDDDAHDDHLQLAVFDDGTWYTVGIYMLFAGESTEAERAQSRAAMLARFPGAVVAEEGGVSAQYTLTGPHWPGATVGWTYNSAGKPEDLSGDFEAMMGAVATWNGASSPFRFTGGSTSATVPGACGSGRDEENTVAWAPQSGATLAVTCVWSRPSQGGQIFVEFDMEFDPDWPWTVATTGVRTDLQSVALHEFGHALGIDHSQRTKCPGPVMCAMYLEGSLVRGLHADDLAALYAVYGQESPPTATPAPTETPLPASPPPTTTPTPVTERGSYRAILPGTTRQ